MTEPYATHRRMISLNLNQPTQAEEKREKEIKETAQGCTSCMGCLVLIGGLGLILFMPWAGIPLLLVWGIVTIVKWTVKY